MVKLDKSDEKICPYCAETIKAAAVKCRYCQSDLTEATPPQVARTPTPTLPPRTSRKPDGQTGQGDVSPPTHTRVTTRSERRSGPTTGMPFLASFRLLGVLVALCLVLAGVAGFAWYRSENPPEGKAPDGVITSAEARDAGMQAATTLTQKVLSYDWKTLDADMKASEALLAPSFRSEYTKTMEGVKAQAVKNQMKLTASVVATSIVSASEKKVEALVFVNQLTTAKSAGNQRILQNRVLVTLTRDGGEWRVAKMDGNL